MVCCWTREESSRDARDPWVVITKIFMWDWSIQGEVICVHEWTKHCACIKFFSWYVINLLLPIFSSKLQNQYWQIYIGLSYDKIWKFNWQVSISLILCCWVTKLTGPSKLLWHQLHWIFMLRSFIISFKSDLPLFL